MVRAAGFLYIRFCCDPKYMFAWFKKHLLDDEGTYILLCIILFFVLKEFKPGADKNSPNITIGDYVEGLLNNQEYYNTRLPRIPTKYETKLKAKLLIN
jgi:pre-mRNA-splicing factor 38B